MNISSEVKLIVLTTDINAKRDMRTGSIWLANYVGCVGWYSKYGVWWGVSCVCGVEMA